jgi:tRNA U38,U39,U40 pseudouridine synthase TruA
MFHMIDFRAESFLWNMVRRIVWMMNEGSSARMPLDQIGPEAKRKPTHIGLARPEFLVLMDIDCGILFPIDRHAAMGITRAIERRIVESAMRLTLEQTFHALLECG